MPSGTPKILRPEFKKCPSIEELERGLRQVSARLSPKDLTWWNNYIEEEKKQRKFWEEMSEEDLRKIQMPELALKQIAYVEQEETTRIEHDEATKKRITEINKLLEKNNNFPEVKIY